jgi:ABC-type transporter MlaC component
MKPIPHHPANNFIRHLAGMACILAWLVSAPPAAASETQPTCQRFTYSLRDKAVGIIHDSDKNFMEKHEALISLFENALDMGWIGHYAAGAYWRNADEDEQDAYDKVYRAYLSDFYIGGFDESDLDGIQDIIIRNFKPRADNKYMARVEITQKDDEPIIIEFHLVETPKGVCHVRDFKTEGVGLLDSQYEEIQGIGAKGSLALITKKLSSRPQTR